MAEERQYWLMKSEPSSFSIDDLGKAPAKTTHWDGVRNYMARNFMRQMRVGDRVLFYHSNADPPAIVGIARVVHEAYPDHTSFDPKDKHFDPRSTPAKPYWYMVDIKLEKKFKRALPLPALRQVKKLIGMELMRKGSRLSVQPVRPAEWDVIMTLATKSGGK